MFKGSIVALTTPMNQKGEIDYVALERLVGWHLENQTDGFVILGTTGESPTIEDHERKQIVSRVVAQVNETVPVIVGAGTNSTKHTIELTRQAMEWGADAALLVAPYYNRPTQEGLYQHFKAVAEAVPLPQVLYNVPSRTGCDLLPETVARLNKFSNIIGLKETAEDLSRLKALLALDCRIDFFTGTDSNNMEFILAGGKGAISVVANVAPKAMHLLCQAALQQNVAEATKWQEKLKSLYKALFLESNPIPTKWVLTQMKLIEGGIRLPLTPLSERFHDDLRLALRQAEIQI